MHHPVRGRIKGAPAFGRFVTDTNTWLAERNVTVGDVNFIVTPQGGVEEVVLHLDSESGKLAIARIYDDSDPPLSQHS